MLNTRAAGAASCPDDQEPTAPKGRKMSGRTASSHGSGDGRHGRCRFPQLGGDDELRLRPRGRRRHRPGHRRQRHTDPRQRLRGRPPTLHYLDPRSYRRHHIASTRPPRRQPPRRSGRLVHTRGPLPADRRAHPAVQLPLRRRRLSGPSTSVGQGDRHSGQHDRSPTSPTATQHTVFGYSQSSTISGYVMQQLDPTARRIRKNDA